MKLEIPEEWLVRKLKQCDDLNAAAGGTSIEQFNKDVEERTVTPSVFGHIPTELGKVVRFIREQHGWTRTELAQLANIDEADVASLETQTNFDPTPRTVTQLADACHFSRARFIQLAHHRREQATNEDQFRFAASSNGTESISDEEYEAVRALVAVLSERSSEEL